VENRCVARAIRRLRGFERTSPARYAGSPPNLGPNLRGDSRHFSPSPFIHTFIDRAYRNPSFTPPAALQQGWADRVSRTPGVALRRPTEDCLRLRPRCTAFLCRDTSSVRPSAARAGSSFPTRVHPSSYRRRGTRDRFRNLILQTGAFWSPSRV